MTLDKVAGNVINAVASSGGKAASGLLQRSALNPVLWMIAIVTPTALISAFFVKDVPILCATMMVLAFIPVLTGCGLSVYFSIHDPDKMRSEDLQIRSESLDTLRVHMSDPRSNPEALAALLRIAQPSLPSGAE